MTKHKMLDRAEACAEASFTASMYLADEYGAGSYAEHRAMALKAFNEEREESYNPSMDGPRDDYDQASAKGFAEAVEHSRVIGEAMAERAARKAEAVKRRSLFKVVL